MTKSKTYFKTKDQRDTFIDRITKPIGGEAPQVLELCDGSISVKFNNGLYRTMIFIISEHQCWVITRTTEKTTATALQDTLEHVVEKIDAAMNDKYHEIWKDRSERYFEE